MHAFLSDQRIGPVWNAALIVAAGRGVRAGEGIPKQYRRLAGRAVLGRTLDAFLSHAAISAVQTVIAADDGDAFQAVCSDLASPAHKLRHPVPGGATRQESVRAGLEALAAEPELEGGLVLVHDAARPFVDHVLIDRAIAAGRAAGAAVPGIPVTDTVKVISEDGHVVDTPPRDRLRSVQTPQAFVGGPLLAAHRKAAAAGLDGFTDDGALAEWAGMRVSVFEGDPANRKLTSLEDFADAERRLGGAPSTVTRIGTGFDVHAFGPGDHVWLGGVRIGADLGVVAHSDGDVVLHALTDAVLGAIADGDIGVHFPPSDPAWRGASSDRFLADAVRRVKARGGVLDHLDVTVLCERPRIGPHRDEIRRRIAEIAAIGVGAVSIKATTTERLGFIGRSEGLAAQAVATVRVPASGS